MAKRGSREGFAEHIYYSDDPQVEEQLKPSLLAKIIGGLAVLVAALFFVNTTLAANISLTGAKPIEFGQGIQQTTACSGNTALSIQPLSTFSNTANGGSYQLSAIKVSNIPTTCYGADFLLVAYGETSTTLLLSQSLGYGALNTKAIIDQGNSNTATSAAALAASYAPTVNGTVVNDWFLPAEDDLKEVWNQKTVIGLVTSGGNYWSSSSVAQLNGRYFIFGGANLGQPSGLVKASNLYVRPARAF